MFRYRWTVLMVVAIAACNENKSSGETNAQIPVLETGGRLMPSQWIDSATGHLVQRLGDSHRSNLSFYFHNDPFLDSEMVYYSTQRFNPDTIGVTKEETSSTSAIDKQLYVINLNTGKSRPLTSQSSPMNGEMLSQHSGNVYYQVKDSVFRTDVRSGETALVFVFPENYKGNISTVNADETLLAGAKASDAQKEVYRKNPEKKDYFNLIYEGHFPNDLFTIDLNTKKLKVVHTENTWLGHIQFSPTDPQRLFFCHEGPWHKVDRMWMIDLATDSTHLLHKRTMDMEIAGHEFPSPDGKKIFYDLQQPRSQHFFLGYTNLNDLTEGKFALQRKEWSIHFNTAPDESFFVGDGANETQVAKSDSARWIYLFKPDRDSLIAEKLVNMQHHQYRLEPNVHVSPDKKWVIFRANFEGWNQVYRVKIEKQ